MSGFPKADMVCALKIARYKKRVPTSKNLTTLAFWLRSSVVSVLNSLTTITEAPPPVLVI